MSFNRRDILGAIAVGAGGYTIGSLGLTRLGTRDDPAAESLDHSGIAEEHEAVSVCGGCSAGCSVKLRLVEGRLVGIRGNPLCPLGAGGLCARGASEVEAYYDPDRIVGPLTRDGERGKDNWKKASWDEALGKVAHQLEGLVGAGRGARIGVILSSSRGSLGAAAESALAAMGSPHVYYVNNLRDEAAASFASLATGVDRPFGYDLETTDLIMSFGSPVLEGWLSPAYVARRFGQGRQRAENRLRLIQIESRQSPTGIRADEWVRCVPGTEPLLALAIASVLVRETLADTGSLDGLVGLNEWVDPAGGKHKGLLPLLDYAYAPVTVSKETGVPTVDILRLARTFAGAHAPLAIGEQTAGSAGVFGLAAVGLLNALRGRVGVRGGVTMPDAIPLSALDGPTAPKEGRLDRPPVASVAGTPIWRSLGAHAVEGRESPFDVLFLEDGAALGDVVEGDPAHKLLSKVPLVVSFASALDASTAAADIVLPATSYFEQTLDVEIDDGGFVAVAAARAAMAPLVDARSPALVLTELARKSGAKAALAEQTEEQMVRHRMAGLHRARRGMPYGSAFRRGWMQQMEEAGWWTAEFPEEKQFVEAVLDRGGWIDPRATVARTPFTAERPYAVDARGRGHVQPAKALFAQGTDDDAWLPRLQMAAGNGPAAAQSLLLAPFTVGVLQGRGTPNRPSLLQMAAPHVRAAFHAWAELNTADASRLGVNQGDRVRIASEHGEVVVATRVVPGVRPGTVALAYAPAAGGSGRYAKNWKSGAERLMAGLFGSLAGNRTGRGMKVLVEADTKGTL